MKLGAFVIAVLMLAASPVLAHHGHNHRGQGHSHDGTPGGTFPAFFAPGHCKHHSHGCASVPEPELGSIEIAAMGLALLGGSALIVGHRRAVRSRRR
jgi:hypothetical protein